MDQTAARDALVTAFQALAAVAPLAALRQALRGLIDDHECPSWTLSASSAPDAKAPPAQEHSGAIVAEVFPPREPRVVPPTHAKRTMRRLPAKAAPAKQTPSTKSKNEVTEWLALREQVQAEMARRGADLDQLAAAFGYAASSTENTMKKRSPPSAPMLSKLRAFAAGGPGNGAHGADAAEGPGGAAADPPGPPGATVGPSNVQLGHLPAPLPDDALKALKARRRVTPMTAGSLAEVIGIATGELDAAIAGEPIPLQAAERLAAWAAG
jgi:hypothetical protein